MLQKIAKFILSLLILVGMLYIGKGIAWLIPIGISENIWGLLTLFFALLSGAIKVEWIAPGARLLTRYMTLFFLPICVGIIEHTELLLNHIDSFLIATFASTVISLVVIGYVAQWILNKQQGKA